MDCDRTGGRKKIAVQGAYLAWCCWRPSPAPAYQSTRPGERVRSRRGRRNAPFFRTRPLRTASMSIRPTRPSAWREYPRSSSWFSAPVRQPYAPAATGPQRSRRLVTTTSPRSTNSSLWPSADGLTVLFELGKEPRWDALGGNTNAPPSDCDTPSASCTSVRQYVTALVHHAAPEGLRYLIVRNEPQDFNKNWVGGDAASYARFQSVVYQAAHAADPVIKVLNGGTEAVTPSLAQHLAPQAAHDSKAIAFATALYSDPSWCNSLDILDLHVGDFGPVWSPQIVDASERAIQACNGGRHMPVWVTEVGYPSIPALQASPVYTEELGDQIPRRRGRPGSLFDRYVQSACARRQRGRHQLDIRCRPKRDPGSASRYERQDGLR